MCNSRTADLHGTTAVRVAATPTHSHSLILTAISSLSPTRPVSLHSTAPMTRRMLVLVFCLCLSLAAPFTAAAQLTQPRSSLARLARAVSEDVTPSAPRISTPNATEWVSLPPWAVHYSHGSLYATYVTQRQQSGLVRLNTASGEVEARLSTSPSIPKLDEVNLVSSDHSLFLHGEGCIVEVDVASFTVVNQLPTPDASARSLLLGADTAGTTLLWSAWGGNQAYTLDARTGNITGNYTAGQTTLTVVAGTLHPSGGSMLLADEASGSLLLIDRHDQLIYRAAYPKSAQQCLSLAVDERGENAYGLFMPSTFLCNEDNPFYYTLLHINYSTGAIVDRAYIDCTHDLSLALFPRSVSAAAAVGEMYYVSRRTGTVNLLSFASRSTESSFFLSTYAYNLYPTPLVAVPLSGLLLVGQQDSYTGYCYVNDSTGQQVGEIVDLAPYFPQDGCVLMTAMAATANGTVYAALCLGPILVMQLLPNGTSQLVNTIEMGNHTVISALAVDEPRSVLYYHDTNVPARITKCDLHGRVIGTLLGQSNDRFADIVVDMLGDGSLWATQPGGGSAPSIYHWSANGTLLSVWMDEPRQLMSMAQLDYSHRYQQLTAIVQVLGVDEWYWTVLWLDAVTGEWLANVTFRAEDGVGGVAVTNDGRTFTSKMEEGTMLSFAPLALDSVQQPDRAVPPAALYNVATRQRLFVSEGNEKGTRMRVMGQMRV